MQSGGWRSANHEDFSKAVRLIYGRVGETTDHGFVCRVDLDLRPNGNSGPPVVSQDALEEYLQVQGREWERFAWLKSRIVAPRAAIEDGSARSLRSTVLPFVFRRYLDYSGFESLRVLHRQIRGHPARPTPGRGCCAGVAVRIGGFSRDTVCEHLGRGRLGGDAGQGPALRRCLRDRRPFDRDLLPSLLSGARALAQERALLCDRAGC